MQPLKAYERRWWTLSVLCLSLVIVVLDNTILNVALPTMVRELHATNGALQWITDSYVLVFAGLLLTAGAVGDRWGRKGALTAGLLVFAAGSVAAALAGSTGTLTIARAVMGAGAAFVFPATLSILTNVFTDATERAKAIAIWSAIAGVGIALGPTLGGWLLDHYYWGSIFLVNLPIVVAALIGGWLVVPTSRDPNAGRLDPIGALLSMAGLVSLVFAVIQAPDRGWTSTPIVAAFALAGVALGSFALWERRSDHPMLDLSLFRDPRFTAASASVTVLYFSLQGTYFILTQHFQFLLGYSPLEAGVRVVPFALVLMPTAILTPRLVVRSSARAVVATGLFIVAASLALRSLATVHTGYPYLLVCSLIFAFGMGLITAPATASIMAAVPREKAGVGSAVNDTTRQVGGALGVAVLGSLFAAGYANRLGQLAPQAPAAASDSIGSALVAAQRLGGNAGATLTDAARHAFIHGADLICLVAAAVAAIGAVAALAFLPRRQPAPVRTVDVDLDIIEAA